MAVLGFDPAVGTSVAAYAPELPALSDAGPLIPNVKLLPIVTIAEADALLSDTLTAPIVTTAGFGRICGAVYSPAAVTVPVAAIPPITPFTLQITPAFVVLFTVALNCCVAPSPTCTVGGAMLTVTGDGVGGVGVGFGAELECPAPHPAAHTEKTKRNAAARTRPAQPRLSATKFSFVRFFEAVSPLGTPAELHPQCHTGTRGSDLTRFLPPSPKENFRNFLSLWNFQAHTSLVPKLLTNRKLAYEAADRDSRPSNLKLAISLCSSNSAQGQPCTSVLFHLLSHPVV
jgi:hypothetical protein